MNGTLSVVLSVGLLAGCTTNESTPKDAFSGDDPRLDEGALLAAVCTGCHADGGETLISLAGYDADRLEALLLAYKQAPDGPTAMHRMARGYTTAQIRSLARHFSGVR